MKKRFLAFLLKARSRMGLFWCFGVQYLANIHLFQNFDVYRTQFLVILWLDKYLHGVQKVFELFKNFSYNSTSYLLGVWICWILIDVLINLYLHLLLVKVSTIIHYNMISFGFFHSFPKVSVLTVVIACSIFFSCEEDIGCEKKRHNFSQIHK